MATVAIAQNVGRGIGLIILAALLISLQDVTFKLFKGDLTLLQIFALRGVFAVPILILLGVSRGRVRQSLRSAFSLWPLLRSLCLTLAFLGYYAAIPFISLSTAGAALYMAPIFVALLSTFVIGERVRGWCWVGVCMGFAGVIVLLQPGSDAFSAFAILPLMGAGFYAVGLIITRVKCQTVSADALALSFTAMMSLAGFLISGALLIWPPSSALVESYPYIFGQWSGVDQRDWVFLFVLAGFAVLIGMALAGAYQAAPPATIATFEYSYLVFVAAWDILFLGIAPTLMSLTGMVMLIAAGVLVMQGGK